MARIVLSPEQYEDLVKRMEDHDYDGKPYPFYTGRGMVGYAGTPSQTCFGWVTSNGPGMVQLELARAHLLVQHEGEDDPLAGATLDTVIDDLVYSMQEVGEPSTDSMGYDTIYYWRGIEVDPSVRDQDDQDEDDDF